MPDKLTIIRHYGTAVYRGDDLIWQSEDCNWTSPVLLEKLGFSVDVLDGRWEDLPCDVNGNPYVPMTLTVLKRHLAEVRRSKRAANIKAAQADLARLEREAKEDVGDG